jgi:hypothetical protein
VRCAPPPQAKKQQALAAQTAEAGPLAQPLVTAQRHLEAAAGGPEAVPGLRARYTLGQVFERRAQDAQAAGASGGWLGSPWFKQAVAAYEAALEGVRELAPGTEIGQLGVVSGLGRAVALHDPSSTSHRMR